MTAKVISIVNNKGGVGKTTTVINLAAAIATFGKKILMIDFDPQASLTICAGFEPLELKNTIYDVITEKCTAKEAIIKTSNENIDIMPANIELSKAEIEIISQIAREMILRNKIQDILKYYDLIIIDNSPSLGILTINSMVASDYVIAPMTATYLALKGVDILYSTIEQVKKINKNLKFMGIIITQFESRTTHHQEVLIATKKKYPVFNTIIKKSIKFADSSIAAQDIFAYAGEKFVGAQEYMQLAREVLQYDQKN